MRFEAMDVELWAMKNKKGKTMPEKLTLRERDLVIELERRESIDPDVGPTFDELRTALGLGSKSGVSKLVRSLVGKGWISTRFNRHRSIRLLHHLTVAEERNKVASGPDPGNDHDTKRMIATLAERGIATLANASDEQILAEALRRGIRL